MNCLALNIRLCSFVQDAVIFIFEWIISYPILPQFLSDHNAQEVFILSKVTVSEYCILIYRLQLEKNNKLLAIWVSYGMIYYRRILSKYGD